MTDAQKLENAIRVLEQVRYENKVVSKLYITEILIDAFKILLKNINYRAALKEDEGMR